LASKLSNNDEIFELRSPTGEFCFNFCALLMPIWWYSVPFMTWGAFVKGEYIYGALGTGLWLACLSILWWNSFNRLKFSQNYLGLPGDAWGGTPYSDIHRIDFSPAGYLTIAGVTRNKPFAFEIGAENLAPEDSGKLWALLASKLKHADITATTRENLKKWNGKPFVYSDGTYKIIEKSDDHGKLAIEIGADRVDRQIKHYLAIYSKTVWKGWVLLWLLGPLALMPIAMIMAYLPVGNANEFLFRSLYGFVTTFSYLGTVGLLTVVLWYVAIFIRSLWHSSLITVTESGITASLKVGKVFMTQEHFDWSDIKSIELHGKAVDPGESNNSFIEIKSRASDWVMTLPVNALRSSSKRQELLNKIKVCGPEIRLSDDLFNALNIEAEQSYTELWLSSLKAAPQLEQLVPLSRGQVLRDGQLEVIEPLASGGQGNTYLAKMSGERLNNAAVVLKEMILPMYDSTARSLVIKRFERDATLLKSLEHDQIVRLLDYFVEDHRAFLILEYVKGKNLKEKIIEDGPFSEPEVCNLIEQMAGILAYLHGRTPPVVHRDFTPDNLIIDDGQLKLIDFDVAFEEAASKIQSTIVGKQRFLPPEQFRGKSCTQSDIYSMGATLYFLLTATEPEALNCSSPKLVQQNLSDSLDTFVQRCTALDLKERFSSAAEIQSYCQNFLRTSLRGKK
jgi:tRNA A-37 threonylcarbamoyl transferase component Bud32